MPKNRIEKLRKSKKLSQSDLANQVGVTRQAISAYETGKRVPKDNIFNKMADFFDVSVPYLMGYSDEEIKSLKESANVFPKLNPDNLSASDISNIIWVRAQLDRMDYRHKMTKGTEKVLKQLYSTIVDNAGGLYQSDEISYLDKLLTMILKIYKSQNKVIIDIIENFVDMVDRYTNNNSDMVVPSEKEVYAQLIKFLKNYK